MKNINLFIYFIIAGFFLGLTGPQLFSDGMFMDGLWYAAIAKNMAMRLGDFWNPHFTATIYNPFFEHPPLAFGIQSILFKVFGDTIYIERFYSLFMIISTAWIIKLIWQEVTGKEKSTYAWIPILLWAIVPVISWGCANNMLENTMTVFIYLAILFIIKSQKTKSLHHIMMAGGMLTLSFLTKGFVGLFPLSFPFWIWIFQKHYHFKAFIFDSLLLIFFTLAPFAFIFLISPEAMDSLLAYLETQVIVSIQTVQTVSYRLWIVWSLLNELVYSVVFIGLLLIINRKRLSYLKTNPLNQWVWTFIGLGLSGVLPIMVTMKQRGFYIIPVFPLFAIALGIIALPFIHRVFSENIISHLGAKIIKATGLILLLAGISLSVKQYDRTGRDKKILSDIRTIIDVVPNQTIGVSKKLYKNWSIHGYFSRFSTISLDTNLVMDYRYVIVEPNYDNSQILDSYENCNLNTHRIKLLEFISQ